MTLLETLRPESTEGWDALDENDQKRLLALATGPGGLETRRALAEHHRLAGEARRALLADRETSIRRRILSRGDLAADELSDILRTEKRAAVLSAVAETARGTTLDHIIETAMVSRGSGLAEHIIAKSRCDDAAKLRLIGRIISSGRSFSDLSSGAQSAVTGATGDPDVLRWLLTTSNRSSMWEVGRGVANAASSITGIDHARKLIAVMTGAESWPQLARFIDLTFDADSYIAGRSSMSGEDIGILSDEIRAASASWNVPQVIRTSIITALDGIAPVLPGRSDGQRSGGQAETEATRVPADLTCCTSAEIAAVLGDANIRLTAEQQIQLATNPNHTVETSSRLANSLLSSSETVVGLFANFDSIPDAVWDAVDGRRVGSVDAAQVIAAIGEDETVRILTTARYNTEQRSRYWRRPRPLIGETSTLTWILADGQDRDHVALRLPVASAAGAEGAAFRLLSRTIGDDQKLWTAVDSLFAGWKGSYQELIDTARGIG